MAAECLRMGNGIFRNGNLNSILLLCYHESSIIRKGLKKVIMITFRSETLNVIIRFLASRQIQVLDMQNDCCTPWNVGCAAYNVTTPYIMSTATTFVEFAWEQGRGAWGTPRHGDHCGELKNWVQQKSSTLIGQLATVHICDWLTKVIQIYEPSCLWFHAHHRQKLIPIFKLLVWHW